MQIYIYLISGKKGSGKSTVARMISRTIDGPTFLFKFADPLKEMTEILTGVKMSDGSDNLEGHFENLVKDYDRSQYAIVTDLIGPSGQLTVRDVLQRLGTEAVRNNIDEDAWLKTMVRRIKEVQEIHSHKIRINIIIPDCRFPNEISIGEKIDGAIVRRVKIVRDGLDSTDKHPSEMALDDFFDWDRIIHNNSSTDELYIHVQKNF